MVECLTQDRRATGSSLTGVTGLWSLSKTHYLSLVLVQPIKARQIILFRPGWGPNCLQRLSADDNVKFNRCILFLR